MKEENKKETLRNLQVRGLLSPKDVSLKSAGKHIQNKLSLLHSSEDLNTPVLVDHTIVKGGS